MKETLLFHLNIIGIGFAAFAVVGFLVFIDHLYDKNESAIKKEWKRFRNTQFFKSLETTFYTILLFALGITSLWLVGFILRVFYTLFIGAIE